MPEIRRFGPGKALDKTGAGGVTWFDVDIAVDADREWLMAWQEISEQTRQTLLEPVRSNHYEQVPEGTLLSIRTLRPGQTDAIGDLADLKLLIGSTRAVTVRSGALAAVDELRQQLSSDRTLVTAVDLLGFLVSAMTIRMEAVVYELTQHIDDVEDALLDGGSVPPTQTLSELRRRIFRARRQVNGTRQVLGPMTTDPALALDADDRETLNRASNHVARYLGSLDECRTRVQMLEDQIEAQRSDTMTRSSLNLTIVATVFLPLSFITGLLGMNVGGIPDEHNPLGFWLVTGLSILIAIAAWGWLRRQTYDRYLTEATIGKKELELLEKTHFVATTGLTPAYKEKQAGSCKRVDPHFETTVAWQDNSRGMKVHGNSASSRGTIGGVYVAALLLAVALFSFHVVVILHIADALVGREAWLFGYFGGYTGRVVLLACLFLLFIAHLVEAAAWGLFFRWTRLFPNWPAGIYFSATSATTLGFGDLVLSGPWRQLGPLIAIHGMLLFGCSTAFLFVILERVWAQHL